MKVVVVAAGNRLANLAGSDGGVTAAYWYGDVGEVRT